MVTRLILAGFEPPRQLELTDAAASELDVDPIGEEALLSPAAPHRRGPTLLAVLRRARVPLGQSCRGQGICRACVVEVINGREHLLSASQATVITPTVLACTVRVHPALASLREDEDPVITLRSPHWG